MSAPASPPPSRPDWWKSATEAQFLEAAARASLSCFVRQAWPHLNPGRPLDWAWYLEAICLHLQAVTEGAILRLLVELPPNCLKSTILGVCWPAWEWTRTPGTRWLNGANNGTLATRDALAMRTLIDSDWYQRTFRPDWELRPDQDEKTNFMNTKGGHRVSVSICSSTIGKKGDKLVLDDPDDANKVRSAAERESVRLSYDQGFSRRASSQTDSPIVVCGQRLHTDDLIGRLKKRGGWVSLRLPEQLDAKNVCSTPIGYRDPRTRDGEWLRPARFGPAQAEEAKASGVYQSQHRLDPKQSDDTWFPRALARIVPAVPAGTVAVRYWDTASTDGAASCDSAGVLVGRTPAGQYIFLDCNAQKLKPGPRDRLIVQTAYIDRRRADCRVEATHVERSAGQGLEVSQSIIRQLAGFAAFEDRASRAKDDRLQPLASQWAVGNVMILDGDWNERFLAEMESLPGGGARDISDAAAGGFNKVALHPAGSGAGIVTGDDSTSNSGGVPRDTYA